VEQPSFPESLSERRSRASSALTWVLAAAILAGVILRFVGLDRRTIEHPENFVSRLVVPSWIEQPRQALDLVAVLKGSLHDGHPPAWFVAMHAWTGLFGTSLLSIRLPSAILGALSLFLVFRLTRRLTDSQTAWLATALLALCGMHVFWSQVARMYVAACFLGLASTLLLLRAERTPGRKYPFLYASCAAIGLWTQLYFWPLYAGQMTWSAIRALRRKAPGSIVAWQLAALILGTPIVALSMHQNPLTRWHEQTAEYFDLGYAFLSTAYFHGPAPEVPVPRLLVRFVTVGLVLVGLFGRKSVPEAPASGAAPRSALLVLLAVLASAGILGFAAGVSLRAGESRTPLFLVGLLPLLLALAATRIDWLIARVSARRIPFEPPLDVILALLPLALMILVSLARGVLVARGRVVFLPYLMIAVAVGVGRLARMGVPRWIPTAFLLLVSAASVRYHWDERIHKVDNRGLARAMAPLVRPDDLVLVHNNWLYASIYYDTPVSFDRFLWRDREAAMAAEPRARVWVIALSDAGGRALLALVKDYRPAGEVSVFGAKAYLFDPPLPR